MLCHNNLFMQGHVGRCMQGPARSIYIPSEKLLRALLPDRAQGHWRDSIGRTHPVLLDLDSIRDMGRNWNQIK